MRPLWLALLVSLAASGSVAEAVPIRSAASRTIFSATLQMASSSTPSCARP